MLKDITNGDIKMKKKRILFSLLYLFYPLILVILSTLYLAKDDMDYLSLIIIHVISILCVVLFFLFKPCSAVFSLIGAVISSLSLIICGFINSDFILLAGLFHFRYYSLYYIIINFLILGAIQNKKGKSNA
jgi:hypothetical protein